MDAEAVIAEATKEAAPQAQAAEVKVEKTEPDAQNQVEDNQVEQETEEETQDISKKLDSELTEEQLRKREANRQSHLKSKLARITRQNRELQEMLAKAQPNQASPTPKQDNTTGAPAKPNEDNFQTWGEYQDALGKYYEDLADWKVEQKLAERDKKTTETTQEQEVNAQKLQRIHEIAAQEQEFAKSNPEYTALYTEHADFMDNMPKNVAEALLEAENATIALYALMKEGRLESLEDMSPYRISMEIGKAEIRGESYLKQRNKVSNAPTPMEAAKGTGTASKSLADKSVEELLKQFNSR